MQYTNPTALTGDGGILKYGRKHGEGKRAHNCVSLQIHCPQFHDCSRLHCTQRWIVELSTFSRRQEANRKPHFVCGLSPSARRYFRRQSCLLVCVLSIGEGASRCFKSSHSSSAILSFSMYSICDFPWVKRECLVFKSLSPMC